VGPLFLLKIGAPSLIFFSLAPEVGFGVTQAALFFFSKCVGGWLFLGVFFLFFVSVWVFVFVVVGFCGGGFFYCVFRSTTRKPNLFSEVFERRRISSPPLFGPSHPGDIMLHSVFFVFFFFFCFVFLVFFILGFLFFFFLCFFFSEGVLFAILCYTATAGFYGPFSLAYRELPSRRTPLLTPFLLHQPFCCATGLFSFFP